MVSNHWWKLFMPKLIKSPQFDTWENLASWVAEMGNGEDLSLFLCCFWSLWSRCNLHLFEGVNQSHKEAFEHGLEVLRNYQSSLEPRHEKLDLLKWEPPPINSHKLNVDAMLFFDLTIVGLDAIVCDWRGINLLATSVPESHVAQPETVEALSILGELQLCLHQGFDPLIIECDYLLVVGGIQKQ